MNQIFLPESKHVIYIFAPPFKRASAGVTVLHLLCDLLNRHGQPSFIVPDYRYYGKFGYSRYSSSSSLICPVVTTFEIQRAIEEEKIPIVVYPETIADNPLHATNIIRYLLYYNKALDKNSDALLDIEGKGLIYYTNDIGRAVGNVASKVLFADRLTFPVQNPAQYEPRKFEERVTDYYYAEKFIHVHGGIVPKFITENAIRITRDAPSSPSPEELRKLLSSARLLHVFEDTAISYEAMLAGCVVNYHPKGVFENRERSTTIDELGIVGTISKEIPSAEEVKQMQSLLTIHIENYEKWMEAAYSDFKILLKNIKLFEAVSTKDFENALFKYAIQLEKHAKRLNLNMKVSYITKILRRTMKGAIVAVLGERGVNELLKKLKIYAKKLPKPIYRVVLSIYIKIM